MGTSVIMMIDASSDTSTKGLSARQRLAWSGFAGLVTGGLLVAAQQRELAPLGGWDIAAASFLVSVWTTIGSADGRRTAALAAREDNSRALADVVLLCAAVASLVGVGFLLVQGAAKGGPSPGVAIGVGIASVIVSWLVVHTVFTLKYARVYYSGAAGGVDFNEPDPPSYLDFAYLAFTIGMTFQVSDTNLTTKAVRSTALRHALLSYLFGTVIIATTINLVAGLAK